MFEFLIKSAFYHRNKESQITSFKKTSAEAQETLLISASHAAETNVCCSLGSGVGLMRSMAHYIGLGQLSSESPVPVPRTAALAHRETIMQDIKRDVQCETQRGTHGSQGERSPQMVSAQGPSAQKGENGTGHAGEQPGL